MTVSGDTSAVATGARSHADLFTAAYEQNWDRLRKHITFVLLDWRHAHLAEDMTQDVFLKFWKNYVLPERLQAPDKCFPLLKLMARSVVGDWYDTHASRTDALDLTDPANGPLMPNGHAYGHGTPGLAALVSELETAMNHMSTCSGVWRELHKERFVLHGYLADDYLAYRGGLTDAAKARHAARLQDADREEVAALETFRAACLRVGELRAEIEAAAGVNWRSASGMPAAHDTQPIAGRYRNDLTITHCPAGHLLEKDNVQFAADGSRRCRPCATARQAPMTKARRGGVREKRTTVDASTIETARTLYLDPENSLSLAAIARQVGISTVTMYRRIPELAARRTGINPSTRKNSTERTTA
ncbi:hypothetical protein AB0454_35575 [Streptomyces sp. NPDC093509]|uniref:RNA polymerase sigma factor n=1 Tax=Streptomyces sp. NPDC093509 TaxID=3154982 RepID=UPI00344F950E